MTSVRLAVCGPPDALARGLQKEPSPALLVSYVYLKAFLKARDRYFYRDWVLDSGAFSAFNSGTEIKLQDYIDKCKELLAGERPPSEVFSLDVIGDWQASQRNTEEMWRQGVQAIPCFHLGSPEEALLAMRQYPKIALGGMFKVRGIQKKRAWASQCFARVWPKKIHGFAVGAEEMILSLPWHSVDATNWEIGPCAFGRWASYKGANLGLRGGAQNIRAEVEHYLRIEQRARRRWRTEMELLNSQSS